VKKAPILATVALVALAVHDPAAAADPAVAVKAPATPPTYDWDGFYVGGHVAYGPGHTRYTVWDPAPIMGTNSFGGLMAGLHAGYNYVLPSRILLGIEGDISVPNFLESNAVLASVPRPDGDLIQQLDYVGTVRGRAGYVFEPWMVYATGGFAFAGSRILNPLPSGDAEKALRVRPGWVAGGGAEYAFAPHWTLQFQYLYSRYASAEAGFPSGARYAATMDLHELRLGLNRKLDWSYGAGAAAGPQAITESPRWEMHGQTTYIQQAHLAFRSSYFGTNSLTPWPETRNTWSSSLFLGFRLWDGGELYYNPELLQGFGFNDTVGLAGPAQIRELFSAVNSKFDYLEIGVHLHSRPDQAAEKVLAAYDAGCRRFDSALGGLGGCPFAQDALVGNIATESVVEALQQGGAELPPLKSLDVLLRITAELAARYTESSAAD